jgi:hypothetical protein
MRSGYCLLILQASVKGPPSFGFLEVPRTTFDIDVLLFRERLCNPPIRPNYPLMVGYQLLKQNRRGAYSRSLEL